MNMPTMLTVAQMGSTNIVQKAKNRRTNSTETGCPLLSPGHQLVVPNDAIMP